MESSLPIEIGTYSAKTSSHNGEDLSFIRQLILHMMIEQQYTLLADVTEGEIAMPDQEEWLEKIERCTDEQLPELLLEYDLAILEHSLSWQPVGGSFEDVEVNVSADEVATLPPIALPELLCFKRYANRILVKLSQMTCRIALFITHTSKNPLEKQGLIQQAIALREKLLAENDAIPSGPMKFTVQYEVYFIGQNDSSMLKDAEKLTIHFNAKNHVFISCICINDISKNVTSPSPIKLYSRLRQVRKVLQQPELTATEIRQAFSKNILSWGRILSAAILSFLLVIAGRILLISNGIEGIVFINDIMTPFIVIACLSGTIKNKMKLFEQTLYSYIGFFLLLCSFVFLLGGPVSFEMIYYIFKTGLVGGGLLLLWVKMAAAYS